MAASQHILISASNDDVRETSDTTLNTNSFTVAVGRNANAEDVDLGLRFTPVNIAQGAKITSAHLYLQRTAAAGNSFAGIFKGINVDNCAPWATNDRPSQRPKTSATVTYSPSTLAWGVNRYFEIDVTPIVQEIINRPGWASGNALGLVWENNQTASTSQTRTVQTFDGNSNRAPRLVIATSDSKILYARRSASTEPNTANQLLEAAGTTSTAYSLAAGYPANSVIQDFVTEVGVPSALRFDAGDWIFILKGRPETEFTIGEQTVWHKLYKRANGVNTALFTTTAIDPVIYVAAANDTLLPIISNQAAIVLTPTDKLFWEVLSTETFGDSGISIQVEDSTAITGFQTRIITPKYIPIWIASNPDTEIPLPEKKGVVAY
ncbi:MAG: hypothetical protein QXW38_08395 [Candidatus Nitrosotenuis sp.]